MLSLSYIFTAMHVRISFKHDTLLDSSSDALPYLLHTFNTMLIFGVLAALLTFFASIVSIFSIHNATRQFNSSLILCSLIHISLLMLSTICLIAVSISIFVVRNINLSSSTNNSLSVLTAYIIGFGIPIQILFIVLESWSMFIRPKLNHIFGKQPNAQIFLC